MGMLICLEDEKIEEKALDQKSLRKWPYIAHEDENDE